MAAAKVDGLLTSIFGAEPRGVTLRPTWQVLSVIGYERDSDARDSRISREMMRAK